MIKDTIYYIGFRHNKLYVGELPIEKETDKLYYLNRISNVLGDVRILKKSEENMINDKVSWTTNATNFDKLKKAFVLNRKQSLKGAVAADKEMLRRLIKDARELKIKI